MKALGKEWHTTRHAAYATCDMPLAELPNLDCKLRPLLRSKLLARAAEATGFNLYDLYFKDLFFVKYACEAQGGGQRELALHRDGSVLSMNVLLSSASEFQGGGTFFDHTKRTVSLEQGQAVVHCGRILHAGRRITAGRRILLVGFIETVKTAVPSHLRALFGVSLDNEVARLEIEATLQREGRREGDAEQDMLHFLKLACDG